jgi:hypothetical protein
MRTPDELDSLLPAILGNVPASGLTVHPLSLPRAMDDSQIISELPVARHGRLRLSRSIPPDSRRQQREAIPRQSIGV